MVALARDQQLGQAARLRLEPAQPVLCGAGGGAGLLIWAAIARSCSASVSTLPKTMSGFFTDASWKIGPN